MKKKLLIIGLLLVVIVAGTVACASRETGSDTLGHPAVTTTATSTSFSVGSSGKSNYDYEEVSYPGDTIPQVPAPTITMTQPAITVNDGETTWSGERMIIRTADMYLVVDDVATVIQQITALAENSGGFVVNSNSWQDGERAMGNISIRVAAGQFTSAMTALRSLAVEVRSESTSGQDVTEEYVDLTAQLTTLEASQEQLLVLMEQAGTVEEILEVQRELTKTRTEIEQIKGRMQYLEQSSALSLISINLEQSKLTVEFNASTRSVKEKEEIRFYPEVTGGFTPYSYLWDFGDGDTSTESNPTHKYTDDGTYTVSLTVTDDHGTPVVHEREDYITVLPGWSAGSIASSAWNGLISFGRVLLNILIWLGIFSPVWILIGVVIYLIVRKKRNRKTGP